MKLSAILISSMGEKNVSPVYFLRTQEVNHRFKFGLIYYLLSDAGSKNCLKCHQYVVLFQNSSSNCPFYGVTGITHRPHPYRAPVLDSPQSYLTKCHWIENQMYSLFKEVIFLQFTNLNQKEHLQPMFLRL